ncbi:MAG: hypothetical protein VR64_00750 [Desulfatitalea sp. BRH_c12]|nr:MAG: hypothetical protein VR64_00750 [Desulfatitalea sp. BRH_c12]
MFLDSFIFERSATLHSKGCEKRNSVDNAQSSGYKKSFRSYSGGMGFHFQSIEEGAGKWMGPARTKSLQKTPKDNGPRLTHGSEPTRR